VAIQNIIDQTTPASEALSGLNGGNYTGDRDPQKAAHFMLAQPAPNISQQFCLENGMGFLSVNPAVGIFFRVSRSQPHETPNKNQECRPTPRWATSVRIGVAGSAGSAGLECGESTMESAAFHTKLVGKWMMMIL
jgi:hypothetical protein